MGTCLPYRSAISSLFLVNAGLANAASLCQEVSPLDRGRGMGLGDARRTASPSSMALFAALLAECRAGSLDAPAGLLQFFLAGRVGDAEMRRQTERGARYDDNFFCIQ